MLFPDVVKITLPISNLTKSRIVPVARSTLTVSLTSTSGCGNLIVLPSWVTMYGILFGPTDFVVKAVSNEEAKFKLCRVKRREVGPNKVPYIVTHDGRTIRFPHPDIDVHDTIKVDIATGTILDFVKFETGNVIFTTSGNNIGRVGIVVTRERHLGGFDIVHVQDERG